MVAFNTYFALALALVGSVVAAPTAVPEAALEKRVTHTGRGTFFNVGLGACGKTNVDSDHIVAIPSSRFANGDHCEQFVQITNTKTKKTALALVRDSCPGCGGGDLDMSPSLFQALGATLDQGVMTVSWHFMNKSFRG
ncbi:RlpA-like double-psi beta-barrel-protein domain-containing protein-containing protein [Epithele typhae]|uniref:RlpA-like double-psi beta-barrel-protein domain-containing protein-containing protein n=1 Tax=Epithele typhae TaxID=378194 RepID=UPI002008CA46|nr:RlpA-like double-psi beta-barrel-protein domain-containing protein-containing protein [Epithele typhae]KAH9939233.1 RlpA-like double-psi beta-barrel-protein domain-containing protein-containing protein [Epithele typhae]